MPQRRFGPYSFESSREDKVLFAESGITKGDLLEYYVKISKVMLPHLRGRPVTMERYPDGIAAKGFYHKEAPDYFPAWIERVKVRTASGRQQQVVCSNAASLAYLADQACITPHVWLSRADRLDRPDQMIFDLDPAGDDFAAVRQAALLHKELLEQLGLAAFVKTTGSKGLHVVVPLRRSADFDTVRAFAQDLAKLLAQRHSTQLTTEQRKNKRRGRVYLDTGRNAYGQTAVPPYAVRARASAAVATPIDWQELEDGSLQAQSYTMENIFKRLGQRKDPWASLHRRARSLAQARRRLKRLLE